MVSLSDVYARRENVVTREVVGETLLVPISGELADMEKIFTFNSTGRFIWENINGISTFGEILSALLAEYAVDSAAAEQDLRELISDLLDVGLVVHVHV